MEYIYNEGGRKKAGFKGNAGDCFVRAAAMGSGKGCKVHLRTGELPGGSLVVKVSKHYTAVIDGVIHDIYNCSRKGSRCVYGYYEKLSEKNGGA